MKVPVHRKIDAAHIPKSWKSMYHAQSIFLLLVLFAVHVLVIAAYFVQGQNVPKFASLFVMLFLLDVLAVWFIFFLPNFPKESGCLEFQEESVRFHTGSGFSQYIRYAEVAKISIGMCPEIFTRMETKSKYCPKETWAEIYGERYIVAADRERIPLFACAYDDAVWNFLKEKYRNTAVTFHEESV